MSFRYWFCVVELSAVVDGCGRGGVVGDRDISLLGEIVDECLGEAVLKSSVRRLVIPVFSVNLKLHIGSCITLHDLHQILRFGFLTSVA